MTDDTIVIRGMVNGWILDDERLFSYQRADVNDDYAEPAKTVLAELLNEVLVRLGYESLSVKKERLK